jgi:hypothetical protein
MAIAGGPGTLFSLESRASRLIHDQTRNDLVTTHNCQRRGVEGDAVVTIGRPVNGVDHDGVLTRTRHARLLTHYAKASAGKDPYRHFVGGHVQVVLRGALA